MSLVRFLCATLLKCSTIVMLNTFKYLFLETYLLSTHARIIYTLAIIISFICNYKVTAIYESFYLLLIFVSFGSFIQYLLLDPHFDILKNSSTFLTYRNCVKLFYKLSILRYILCLKIPFTWKSIIVSSGYMLLYTLNYDYKTIFNITQNNAVYTWLISICIGYLIQYYQT